MASQNSEDQSDSQKRLEELTKEEQAAANAFQIANFYQHEKLNVNQLKNRLEEFKKKRYNHETLEGSEEAIHRRRKAPKVESGDMYSGKFVDHLQSRVELIPMESVMERVKQKLTFVDERISTKDFRINKEKDAQRLSRQMSKQEASGARKSALQSALERERYLPEPIRLIKNGKGAYPNPEIPTDHFVQKQDRQIRAEMNQQTITEKIPQNGYRTRARKELNIPVPPKNQTFTLNTSLSRKSNPFHSSQKQQNQRRKGPCKFQAMKESHVSESSQQRKSEKSVEPQLYKKIQLSGKEALDRFQREVRELWELYQLLTQILVGMKDSPARQKIYIVQYVEDMCSDKYEFISLFLERLTQEYQEQSRMQSHASRVTSDLLQKRIARHVVTARLLEHLAIAFLSLSICKQEKTIDSNLVNFVGYCTSNVIFLIKLMDVFHVHSPIKDIIVPCTATDASPIDTSPINPFSVQATDFSMQATGFSGQTCNIFLAIRQFQLKSYLQQLKDPRDILLRLQHNNSTIALVQHRLAAKIGTRFQEESVRFLKEAEREHKPLKDYAHYLFEFLAYHLHQENLLGSFTAVQMVPAPYLALKQKATIVIEPWQVLLASKRSKIFIRAYTEVFIEQLSKLCNVVYWTDLMPTHAQRILQHLPHNGNTHILYRHHCRYESSVFVKWLWRMGCCIDNCLIIDRCKENFRYDRDNGIDLPWKGQRNDNKLMLLLQLLLPLLNSNRNLKDSLFGIRADIDIIKKWKMKNTNKIRLHSRGIHALIPEQVIPSSKEEAKFVKGYQSQNRPKKQPPECNDQIYLQFADEQPNVHAV